MINCVFGHGLHVLYGMLIDLQYDLGNSPSSFDTEPGLKTYFFFEMMTYLLVTPIIFLFCMADTTFALKRSEESGA